MKIVQAVGWYHPDTLGGSEVYVAGLVRRLRAAGHEVLVAAPQPGLSAPRSYEHDGAPVFRYPTPLEPTRAEAQGRAATRGSEALDAWLAEHAPDLVHVHTLLPGLGLREIGVARNTGARVLFTSHLSNLGYTCQRGTLARWGTTPCDGIQRNARCAACALEQRGLPRVLGWLLGAIPPPVAGGLRGLFGRAGTALSMSHLIRANRRRQAALLEAVEAFVVPTDWARRIVLANGADPQKVVLLRSGVETSAEARKPGPDDVPTAPPIRVGYVGRYERIKGADDLARAARALPADLQVKVDFCGPVRTREDEGVLAEIRALTADDARVRIVPGLPPEEVAQRLAQHDLVCCPSRAAEAGPLVALEAIAVGTPIVGTRIGGLAEIVIDGQNGRLVAPGDWRALAEVLETVCRDPAGTIDAWRTALPQPRTADDVAADHLVLYEEIQ